MSGSEWFYFGFSTFLLIMLLGFAAVMHFQLRDQWKTSWVPPIWGMVGLMTVFMVGAFFAIFSRIDENYAERYLGHPATALEYGTYFVVDAGKSYEAFDNDGQKLRLVLVRTSQNPEISDYHLVFLPKDKIDASAESIKVGTVVSVTKVTICVAKFDCKTLYHFEEVDQ